MSFAGKTPLQMRTVTCDDVASPGAGIIISQNPVTAVITTFPEQELRSWLSSPYSSTRAHMRLGLFNYAYLTSLPKPQFFVYLDL
jgi:hypothetical protein